MLATVTQLPVPPKRCSRCTNAAIAVDGCEVYCILFAEVVALDTVAEECGEYEPA